MSDELRSTKSVHKQNWTNAAAAIAGNLMQKLRLNEGKSWSDAVASEDLRGGGFFLGGGGRGVDGTARARTVVDLLRRNVDGVFRQREIGFSLSAAELAGGGVVSTRRLLGCIEGT